VTGVHFSERRRRRFRDAGLLIGIWLAGSLVFFRVAWTGSFKKVIGNDGDTRLIVYLCEHWFVVLHGNASWLNPQFFYPTRNLLGWSDTFFLYEIFYAPFRFLGCDPFLALQLTIICLSAVGFFSFVALVRTLFETPIILAAGLGLAFTFSNALWQHSGAYQDNAVYVVPLIALVAVHAWRSASHGRLTRGALLGGLFGALAAILLYSTYYTTYFSVLALASVSAVYLLTGGRGAFSELKERVSVGGVPLLSAFIVFVVGVVPFLRTYIPARRDLPGPSYAVAIDYAARVHDLANFGAGNVVWSSAIHTIAPQMDYGSNAYEITYAVTPIIMLAAVLGGLWCVLWLRRGASGRVTIARAGIALAAGAVILELLPVHSRFGTPWAVIYHIPGASALRAIDRIDIVANLLALLAIAATVSQLRHRSFRGRRFVYGVALAVVALIAVEQINTQPYPTIPHAQETAAIRAVPRPPAGCSSFYVLDSTVKNQFFYWYQLQAMLISQRLRVPTINGYTAYNPPGWQMENPETLDYLAGVKSWSDAYGISPGLCQLDLGTMQWRPSPGGG
jgi:hypothetical protein